MTRIRKSVGRLHVIINGGDGGRPFRSAVDLAAEVIAGGADTLQYRNKGGSMRGMIAEADAIARLCRRAGVTCIINDRVDLCLAVDADGVHLGGEDMPVPAARRILGNGKLIGATVRDAAGLRRAERESADYAGLGPIFPTSSKDLPVIPFGVDHVRETVRDGGIPVIGIAGVTIENCGEVIAAGAYGVAVIGAVASASDPVGTVRAFLETIHANI